MAVGVVVLAPPALLDPSVAIAACRAGATGVLDLEYASDVEGALGAVRTLARLSGRNGGVRLTSDVRDLARNVLSALPASVTTVVVPVSALGTMAADLAVARARGIRVLGEVVDADGADLAADAQIDGVIAKGLEAGGWVGDETTFILLQRLIGALRMPVWAHGGIGLHTAAACLAAGATGVVLDLQLGLARESALPEGVKAALGRMDGSETVCLGEDLGAPFRVFTRPGLPVLEELRGLARSLSADSRPEAERRLEWRAAVRSRVGWREGQVWPVGQDAAFAGRLARQFVTVGGMVTAVREAAGGHLEAACRLRPLAAGSSLAESHGTRYPIVQGPMTRVSDTAAFAASVAEGGALPFLALALLRGPEIRTLLEETHRMLGDRPWGVGILGFVPLELRQEQLEVIRAVRPPFALIAGGRPDQALSLEAAGIPTYLHVPSPALLRMFLEGGARRFVFEGRECGGHVGPRSSFVLWNTMIDVLLEAVSPAEAASCHVIFAGGVHDALSAAMVGAMAAPLAERGIKVGVLLGTVYIFTEEAVRGGAVLKTFQDEALACRRTALLETGPGHSTRCVSTAFVEDFERERRRLQGLGRSADEVRAVLEELNLGRLRIASKGITRNPRSDEPGAERFVTLSEAEQRRQGMYMIGQVATLRDRVSTIAAVHEDVAAGGTARLESLASEPRRAGDAGRPADIAIVGMACVMPKAGSLEAFWSNILNKVDAIVEIPQDRFDWRQYFDPDPRARDKIYSKWGGFIDPIPFDPARYGMPPTSLRSVEPLQLLTLETVRRALDDAGYATRDFARARTGVIVGVGGGVADLGQGYAFRAGLPTYFGGDVPPELWEQLPEWTEDSFAGIILNVAAGRVANRFDLGGVNYAVDAACASSLAALYAGVRELETGTADAMIVVGADTVQSPFGYLCFAKTRALSPRGRCRTFDEEADGIVIGEGIAAVVLKRLADAERDGDRIYAVIKAVAGSSDGRDRSMTAPRPEGQMLALERAYATAGVSPASVGLVEAHGTGTVAGDQAEIEALTRVFRNAGDRRQWCAVGSVKSMIGHTKCAAGLAGLIKVTKSLHHKVLPPTLGVERPNAKARFPEGPFYVNTESRPWLAPDGEPRRAGVSSFGFGGTNFHVVVEEYTGTLPSAEVPATLPAWPAELFLFTAPARSALGERLDAFAQTLAGPSPAPLRRLAASAWEEARAGVASGLTLAIVAASPDDLAAKVAQARTQLGDGAPRIDDPRGIYFTEAPLARAGSVAFLFPGQGSQYPDMLREVAMSFGEVRGCFEAASRELADCFPEALGRYVFPPPRFSAEEERAAEEALKQTNVAQPALGAAGLGMFRLLGSLGVSPAAAAGHSYGEYVALCAAGSLSEPSLYALSEARGRAIVESTGAEAGTMAAVQGGLDAVTAALDGAAGVWIANVNGPRQVVISGTRAGIAAAVERLETAGVTARPVAVACAFHSPLLAEAGRRFALRLDKEDFAAPGFAVFSNVDARPHPDGGTVMAEALAEHIVKPVLFMDELEAMYAAGCRLFVEVGPRSILTGLVQQTFEGRDVVAVPTDVPGRSGLAQLAHALGRLAAQGVPVSLDRFFAGRLEGDEPPPPPSATTWMVAGGRAWPFGDKPSGTRPAAAPAGVASVREAAPGPAPIAASRPFPAGPPREDAPPAATLERRRDPLPAPAPLAASTPVTAWTAARPQEVASPRAGSEGADPASEVLLQFQHTMEKFLETQRNVMLAYLGAAGEYGHLPAVAVGSAPALAAHEPAIVYDARPVAAVDGVHTGAEPAAIAAEPVGSAEPAAALDRGGLEAELQRVVSDRTGYPVEMLEWDANMEADLGIDSIKRVEILGALRRGLPAELGDRIQGSLETLTQAKTLREVVGLVLHLLADGPPKGDPGSGAPAPAATAAAQAIGGADAAAGETAELLPRFVLATMDQSLDGAPPARRSAGVVLVTADARGVAGLVASALREAGATVVVLREGTELAEAGAGEYRVGLDDPQQIARLLERVRASYGAVGGLLHLAPIGGAGALDQLDLDGWRHRLAREVKGLFHLARAVAPDVRDTPGGFVVAVTALDGGFGCRAPERGEVPGGGGAAGLVKTLAVEWPGTRCMVIDVDPADADAVICASVLRELGVESGMVEVGWAGGHRVGLDIRPAPLDERAAVPELDRDSVVLVTGGARGITAEIAEELARRYRPRLVLVARSPLPAERENGATAGLDSARDVKAALIADLGRGGRRPAPAEVEAAYRALVRDREVRRRIAAMTAAGATVVYHQVDVRDGAALARLVAHLYDAYGRIDAVIHGAGIIEDKLVEDKTPESLDRVFDTKVDGAFVLARTLRPEQLRYLVFFSSIAGRFGNRGQADYVAANEVLNKLARRLDAEWPGRVAALCWGPWSGSGMANDGVARQFAERGIRVVSPAEGRRSFIRELEAGRKGEAEVVLGRGPWARIDAAPPGGRGFTARNGMAAPDGRDGAWPHHASHPAADEPPAGRPPADAPASALPTRRRAAAGPRRAGPA